MNINKLGKRLKNEAAANPAKAIVLVIAACVAVWFWVPLVAGWMGYGRAAEDVVQPATTASPAAPVAQQAVPTAAAAPISATSSETPKPASTSATWKQIADWMHNDPRTMVAPPLVTTRDPFKLPVAEAATPAADVKIDDRRKELAAMVSKMMLTSTIIGGNRRVAQIDGRVYSVGSTIEAGKGNAATPTANFQLIQIFPRQVVLQCGKERFELTIPEPGPSEKVEILGAIGSP